MSLKPREEREANLQDEIVEEFHGGKISSISCTG